MANNQRVVMLPISDNLQIAVSTFEFHGAIEPRVELRVGETWHALEPIVAKQLACEINFAVGKLVPIARSMHEDADNAKPTTGIQGMEGEG